MNGETITIKGDSYSTANEICVALSSRIGLKTDTFGFSLYVVINDKVVSLGDSQDKVFDAISQFEQLHSNSSWKLFFRKEIFASWHNSR